MGVIKTLCCLEHFHLQGFFSSWLMKLCSCLASPGESRVAMQSGQSTATGREQTPCHFQTGHEIQFQQVSQKLDLVSYTGKTWKSVLCAFFCFHADLLYSLQKEGKSTVITSWKLWRTLRKHSFCSKKSPALCMHPTCCRSQVSEGQIF